MVDATISRVRMRDLAHPGATARTEAARALSPGVRFATESGTEASSSPPLSRRVPERPAHAGDGDLVASTI